MASATEQAIPAPSTSFYEQLDSYAWDADTEFQSGLSAILSSASSPEQREELSLRARCFYFARKYGTNVDFDAYKAWRAQKAISNGLTATPETNGSADAASVPSNEPEPGPKLSYQEIVDLIQSGKPVPGIKEIPNTVLAGQGTNASKSTRKKPWEKDTPAVEPVAAAEATDEATA